MKIVLANKGATSISNQYSKSINNNEVLANNVPIYKGINSTK